MESWSYVSGERGFVSEDSVTASDDIARSRNGSMDWEFKSPLYGSGNNNVGLGSSSQEAIENMGILDMGFHHTMRKAVSNNSIKDALGTKLSGVRMINSPPENAFWGEEESNSKLSSSVVEFSGADSSLFDLKLGRFDDQRDALKLSASRVALNMYSTDSSKRIRVGGLNALTPYCQVLGCKKDLSSSKDYHKRHKVCEVHSKTPKVIVNGIEQRFCQQCSRFHLLFEFDDGKRSCRKRLAGHNERRRKPHTGIHSGRSGRLYQTYNSGSALGKFQGTAVPTSFLDHHNVLSGCLSQQQKYARNDWSRDIKHEQGANYSSQSAITVARGGLHSQSPIPSYDYDKTCSSINKNGVYDTLDSKSNENSNLFRNASLGGGDAFPGYDSSLTVQALSEFSDSGRALSLLSPQSQTSLSHTSGILTAYPMIFPGNHGHYDVTQVSEKLLGISPQASSIDMPNKFISSGLNSVDNHLNQMISTSGSNAVVSYGIDGMFHGSDYMNGAKEHFSCEDGPTIDLLQLSSQLQRVEDQRQSLHKMPVNDSLL